MATLDHDKGLGQSQEEATDVGCRNSMKFSLFGIPILTHSLECEAPL